MPLILRNVVWEKKTGSCGWWPPDWRYVAGHAGWSQTYWRLQLLGQTGEILECLEAPHYWLLDRKEPRLRFDRLSQAQDHFEARVLREVANFIAFTSLKED